MAIGIGSTVYLNTKIEEIPMIVTGKGSKGLICEWKDYDGIPHENEYPESALTEEESSIYDSLE